MSALRWGDVAEAAAGDGVLVTVRRGKTNPEGEARDVRFVKGDILCVECHVQHHRRERIGPERARGAGVVGRSTR